MRRMQLLLLIICVLSIVLYVTIRWTDAAKQLEVQETESVEYCNVNEQDRRPVAALRADGAGAPQPTLYIITPTYSRPEQLAELTRLGQTLLTVPALTWLVAEDARACSPEVAALLHRLGIPYVHLAAPMPAEYRAEQYVPRGVAGRRGALRHLRRGTRTGVLYFLDDDNAIDIRLLEQIRHTRRVSMFPVGFIGDFRVSAPIVKDGAVTGFFDSWPAGRRFAVDMAGFAVSAALLRAVPTAQMPYRAGYEEDGLLSSLGVRLADIEPLADNCTQVLVWHTRTEKHAPPRLSAALARHPDGGADITAADTNLPALTQRLRQLGVVT